ncbi:MAG: RNA polymerase sporulation sigma factor SigG [Ruminococcaceae bacterium]|nr:RNA polymerase sporulation sigma factor SigG [Oscillospiraceae bacterium]
MYYGKVEICGVNTAKLKTLTAEEKDLLLKKAKEGDETARAELIDGNLRLVLSIIKRFSGRGENMDDLFQVGCIGLIKAVDNFNTDLDVKFSTYAVPMIIGEVRRYLRDNNTIRVSRSTRDLAYKALQMKEKMSQNMGREPSIEELVKALNEENETKTTCEDVVCAMESISEPISLFDPVYNDSSSGDTIFIMDQLSDPINTDDNWLEGIALREAMKQLGNRERKIVEMRFFSGKTQMEIADEIGISQAQVSRLEKGALKKIRKHM